MDLKPTRILPVTRFLILKGVFPSNKMNILRTLEIAWLCVAIFTFCTAMYKFLSEGISEGLFMLIISVISILLYMMRKKQRIRMQRQQSKEDTTVNYH